MSGHGMHRARRRQGDRIGSRLRRWGVLATTGVFTLGIFGAAANAGANADEGRLGRDGARAVAPTTEPSNGIGTPMPPDDLGADAELDALAEQCFGGDLVSCDHLFLRSPVGSEYERYGDTCAGRQEAGTEDYCGLGSAGLGPTETTEPTEPTEPSEPTDTTAAGTETTAAATETSEPAESGDPIPPDNLGADPTLDALAEQCYLGEMQACDDLYVASEAGSDYRTYGDTCAGRQPELTGRFCTSLESPVPGTGPVGSAPDTTTAPDPPDTTAPETTTGSEPPVTSGGSVPPATEEPTGLGNDPDLDVLAQACYAGDMSACDDLYNRSEPASEYRRYGDTCAGRQPENTGDWCRTTFGAGTDSTEGTAPGTTVPVPVPPVTTLPPMPGTVPVPVPPVTTLPATLPPLPTAPVPTIGPPAVPEPTFPVETTTPPVTLPPLPTVPVPTVPVPTVPTPTFPVPTETTLPVPTVPGAIPPPTMLPTGLGANPAFDALAQACYDGDMASCDQLYREADADTDPLYRDFADTCAGRQAVGTGRWCAAAFPATAAPTTLPGITVPTTGTAVTVPPTGPDASAIPPAAQQPTGLGTDPALDALAERCYNGEMHACDDLFLQSQVGTPYHAYGDTCAGRQPAGTYTYCHVAFPGTQP